MGAARLRLYSFILTSLILIPYSSRVWSALVRMILAHWMSGWLKFMKVRTGFTVFAGGL